MKDSRSIKSKEYSKKIALIYTGAVILCLLVALALTMTILKLSGPGVKVPDPTSNTEPPKTTPQKVTETPPATGVKTDVQKPDYSISNVEYSSESLKEGILAVIGSDKPGAIASKGELVLLKSQSDLKVKVSKYNTYLTENAYNAINSLQADLESQFNNNMTILILKSIGVTDDGDISENEFDEHCTGNAMDIRFMDNNSVSYNFDNSRVYSEVEWIRANAWKYGLIFRYTESKVAITGHEKEIGHLRYVGVTAAKYMYENNLCLEEFISILKDYSFNSPLVVDTPDGKTYRMYYTAIDESGSTKVYYRSKSESETYGDMKISGNGSDGFIVIQEFSSKA